MLNFILLSLKGIAMGIANVVPGVSGGTIALITNIYEEFINSLKAFNLKAFKLLIKWKLNELAVHINFKFIFPIFFGIIFSVLSLAKLFDFLLVEFPEETWAYFFGLVLASIYPIGKNITKWDWSIIVLFILGIGIASVLSFMSPSPTENTSILYILICGAIGICGMILPGLSGSYILMLMGNYQLLMVKSINSLTDFISSILKGELNTFVESEQFDYLIYFIVFLIGSVAGILAFSALISWVFKRYGNQTLSILTGFVFGSLTIIWPWKKELVDVNTLDRNGQAILVGYERYIPQDWSLDEFIVIAFMILGVASIIIVEYFAKQKK